MEKEIADEFREILRKKLPNDQTGTGDEDWTRFRDILVAVAVERFEKTNGKRRWEETLVKW